MTARPRFVSRQESFYRRRLGVSMVISGLVHLVLLFGLPAPKQWSEGWRAPQIGFAGPELHLGELNPQDYPLAEQEQLASARRRAGALSEERVEIEPESRNRERILQRIENGQSGRDRVTNPVLELTEDWALRSTSAPSSRRNEFIILHMVRPPYPQIAIHTGIEGLVRVQAWINTQGDVIKVELLESEVDASCEEETERAMLQWRFRPYRIDGRPVEFSVIVPFRFRLE